MNLRRSAIVRPGHVVPAGPAPRRERAVRRGRHHPLHPHVPGHEEGPQRGRQPRGGRVHPGPPPAARPGHGRAVHGRSRGRGSGRPVRPPADRGGPPEADPGRRRPRRPPGLLPPHHPPPRGHPRSAQRHRRRGPARAGTTGGVNPAVLADEVDRRIAALDRPLTEPVRRVRREVSAEIRGEPGGDVVALASALVGRHRWVAYELLYHHPAGMAALTLDDVEALGEGMAGWAAVDAFGRYVSGPAWQQRRIPDAAVRRWAGSSDRWWRRAALVSTVPLNLAAAGGHGDAPRTLAVCCSLVADRDDMVV